MLKQISEIKNVGTFSSCKAQTVELKKISLVYGRNTYGKSTLGDVFYSLEKDQSDLLQSRKSIPEPENSGSQFIKMIFASDGEGERDGLSLYSNGTWQRGLRASHNLRTFNDAFFHEYVFSARKFTRETKVNFSQFILGDAGVSLANEINEKNQEKSKAKRRLKELTKDVFSSVTDLNEFVGMNAPSEIQEIQNELVDLENEKHNLKATQRALDDLRNRKELLGVSIDSTPILTSVAEANEVFTSTLASLHDQAKERLTQHLEANVANIQGNESWIQHGLKYSKNDNCQFCGQTLSSEATQLIESYKQYFDEEFDRHESYVVQELDSIGKVLQTSIFRDSSENIRENELIWEVYSDAHEYKLCKEELSDINQKILAVLVDVETELGQIKVDYLFRSEKKKIKPHQAVAPIVDDRLIDLLTRLDEHLDEYVALLDKLGIVIGQYKEHLDDDLIREELNSIAHQIQVLKLQLLRAEKSEACDEYMSLNNTIQRLDVEIPELEKKLIKDQSAYLDRYFEALNKYFGLLGSQNFELEKKLDISGHTPVYSLKVKFHRKEISESDLDKVFSESDRRALGLSVFLASLDAMEEGALAKTVVVFDDPVTSFDDNRVSQTHREIVNLSKRCEQVILLSHYRTGIAQFLKTYSFSNSYSIQLIEITRDSCTSGFKIGDLEQFILSAHEENRERIIDFVERRSNSLPQALRPYLEHELSLRFGKQIRQLGISSESLDKRVDDLLAKHVITKELSDELHEWRKDLNPEHHVWLGNDIEDKRSVARSFIEFIYHKLVPAS